MKGKRRKSMKRSQRGTERVNTGTREKRETMGKARCRGSETEVRKKQAGREET